jgi:hypothetical protein
MQGDSGENVSTLRGEEIDRCEELAHINMYLILNGYGDSGL